jgi:hypothetical protein
MSAALLVRLEQLGISVEQDGDRLLLDGPEDVLTDDLIAEIAAAKPVLLTALSTDDRRQPPADVADAPPTQGSRLTRRSRARSIRTVQSGRAIASRVVNVEANSTCSTTRDDRAL